jgi:hypothetical protein
MGVITEITDDSGRRVGYRNSGFYGEDGMPKPLRPDDKRMRNNVPKQAQQERDARDARVLELLRRGMDGMEIHKYLTESGEICVTHQAVQAWCRRLRRDHDIPNSGLYHHREESEITKRIKYLLQHGHTPLQVFKKLVEEGVTTKNDPGGLRARAHKWHKRMKNEGEL